MPADFDEIILSLQLNNEEGEEQNDIQSFYTNKNQVEHTDHITEKKPIEYREDYLNIQKTQKFKEIEELQSKNKELNENTKQCEDMIATLKGNQKYETEAEIEESNKKISKYSQMISENTQAEAKNNEAIEELENNIKEIDATIKKIQKE